jgi:hypothetical protein
MELDFLTALVNLIAAALGLSVAAILFFKKSRVGQRTLTPLSYRAVTLAGAAHG